VNITLLGKKNSEYYLVRAVIIETKYK